MDDVRELLELIEKARYLYKHHAKDFDAESYQAGLAEMIMYRYNIPLQYKSMIENIVAGI